MKSGIVIFCLLLICSLGLNAQYNTSTYLYDTISSGPFIEQEGKGYNFYFLTEGKGTMVSTRGLVTNPSMTYENFNHYHIQSTGEVDSIFSIAVRADVNHHYTMYQRGAPKMLQFRVGTSNDPSFEKIKSKYPILGSLYNNDESLEINTIDIANNASVKYNLTNYTYEQGKVAKREAKSIVELEEGYVVKDQLTVSTIAEPISIITTSKVIEGNKEEKFNDLKEFRFLTLDKSGKVTAQEDIVFDRAYLTDNSGLIHNLSGKLSGFYITLIEAGGTGDYKKANEDYNSAVRKLLIFDEAGKYQKEVMLSLPFAPKAKEIDDQKIIKVVEKDDSHIVLLKTKGNKKKKIGEGIYTYLAKDNEAQEINFQKDIDLEIVQELRNKTEAMTSVSDRYDYAVKLENGKVAMIASEFGNDLKMIVLDANGNLINTGTIYLANNVVGSSAKLTFEHLDQNKLLIVSRVADKKSVKTSYSIFNGDDGTIRTIQPEQKLMKINSYRNGEDIIVYGSSIEDEKEIHFVLEKLASKEAGLTMGTN
ncbi:hypothetical protein [Portibacter lacus]|uniref:Uncharacterized protein n=1 Tax=Portibacter lacus TaxID=1099794 RepID=A0AA37SPX4_9BACT|nr:hypothetical protein [Portibacter lacus]GLR16548.1 hypothetical protein GCM10007940_11630 [Portibacter lacus]